jgi:hypothetical protein
VVCTPLWRAERRTSDIAHVLQLVSVAVLAVALSTYKNPRQKRQRRSTFCRSRNCNLHTGTMGTMKMTKSVTMFMHEVRYHTGKV